MATFCEDGRLFRSYVAGDGADGAVEIGACPDWPGCGCLYDIPEVIDFEPRADCFCNGGETICSPDCYHA